MRPLLAFGAACLLVGGCGSKARVAHDAHVTVDGRRVLVRVPASAHPPLLVVLHGYGASALEEEERLGVRGPAERNGMLEVLPEGTRDSYGRRFWNATAACCAAAGPQVDDSRFLGRLIDEVRRRYHADPKRIYVAGLSNGGFMAHRMACDHADTLAAIVSVAGAGALDAGDCKPSGPVAVLEIHGTADQTIQYGGGVAQGQYPSVRQTIGDWARRNGCAPHPRTGRAIHLAERAVADDASSPRLGRHETAVTVYEHCARGGDTELWAMHGADHVPEFAAGFGSKLVAFLLAHPKPQ